MSTCHNTWDPLIDRGRNIMFACLPALALRSFARSPPPLASGKTITLHMGTERGRDASRLHTGLLQQSGSKMMPLGKLRTDCCCTLVVCVNVDVVDLHVDSIIWNSTARRWFLAGGAPQHTYTRTHVHMRAHAHAHADT